MKSGLANLSALIEFHMNVSRLIGSLPMRGEKDVIHRNFYVFLNMATWNSATFMSMMLFAIESIIE